MLSALKARRTTTQRTLVDQEEVCLERSEARWLRVIAPATSDAAVPRLHDEAEREKLPSPARLGWLDYAGGIWSASDWEAVAKGAHDFGRRWPDCRPKFCLCRRGALGQRDVQLDAALVGDVAHHVPPNPAASGVSPIGAWRGRLCRLELAIRHRGSEGMAVSSFASRWSCAQCSQVVWLRCGWTTYACGRWPHRGSG
jgi:hypothetical protein